MCRLPILLMLSLAAARPGASQATAAGTLQGVATDQQGAVVPGVAVTATSATVPGTYAATTDRAGQYRLRDLPPGDYTIVAELAGFARVVRTPVTIRAGLNVQADLVMKIGAIGETIEVRQDTPLLETRTGAQAVNISGELLRSSSTYTARIQAQRSFKSTART
jgi:hypothetical protein